jgi:integrase
MNFDMSKLSKNLLFLSHATSGAFETRADRDRHLVNFSNYLRKNNINIEHVSQIKCTHIKSYVINRKEVDQVSFGTISNELASIKKILRHAGRHQLADLEELTNKALGIDKRRRVGNKQPISSEDLNKYIADAFARDFGFACCLLLALSLGLRQKEAIQAYKSIPTWIKNVEGKETRVTVIFGTKGGRPREAVIINHHFLLEILKFCLAFMKKNHGFLVNKTGIKEAKSFVSNSATAINLVAEESFHALRYSYVNLLYNNFQESNFTEVEKFGMLACALGHSSGRATYVKSVYGKTLLTKEELNFKDVHINFPPIN